MGRIVKPQIIKEQNEIKITLNFRQYNDLLRNTVEGLGNLYTNEEFIIEAIYDKCEKLEDRRTYGKF